MKRDETNLSDADDSLEETLSLKGDRPFPNPHSFMQRERRSSRYLLDGLPVTEISNISGYKQTKRILRGILRSQSQRQTPTAPCGGNRGVINRVTFSNIYLREYARTVGDNPSCSSGVPISLAWEHSETRALELEVFESIRIANLRKRAYAAGGGGASENVEGVPVLAKEERERILREEWGVTQAEMAAAVREGLRIKHSRKTNVHNQSSTAGKVVSVISKLTNEKTKAKQTKEESRLLAKAKAAVAAQKHLLEQKGQARAKLKQQSPRKALSSCRLSTFFGSDSDDDSGDDMVVAEPQPRKILSSCRLSTFFGSDSDDDSGDDMVVAEPQGESGELAAPETQRCPEPRRKQLVQQKLVLERHRPGYHPKRTILKSSRKKNRNINLQNSVSFAADPSTRQIWCTTREFTKVDVSLLDSLWWTEDDMDDRSEQDMEICNLVQSRMAQILGAAFKSTRARAMITDYDFEMISCEDVELNFRHYRQCSIARGLEKEIVPEVRNLIVQSHRKVVLTKQQFLGEMRAECEGVYVMNQDDWESIRKSCIKFSLPSRLLALKLGAFDQFSVMGTT